MSELHKNNNLCYVGYYHSPLTKLLIQAWFDYNEVSPKNRAIITSRDNESKPLDASWHFILPHSTKKWKRRCNLFIKTPFFWRKLSKKIGGDFIFITPHLLNLPIRLGAVTRYCKVIHLIEDGLLSFRGCEASVKAISPLHRLVDMLGCPGEKVVKHWSSHPESFSDASEREVLNLPKEKRLGNYGVCVLVDILRPPRFGKEEEAIFNLWVTRTIDERGWKNVALKIHPSLKLRPAQYKATVSGWRKRLQGCNVTICEQSLDFVTGDGVAMLGVYSSLLIYAHGNGWECLQPDDLVDNLADKMPGAELVRKIISQNILRSN